MGRLPRWLLLGLLIRILLIPFHHPWDLQTWYNMFVDLAHDHSPYETLRYLTYSTRSLWGLMQLEGVKTLPVGQELFYEYYAYPPLPLVIYYPLAKIYARFHPLHYQFVVEGTLAAHHVPLFMLGLLNPLIILVSGAWTIEPLMILPTLIALYFATRDRYELSGFFLGLGVLTKWMPAVLWPAVGIWLLTTRASWPRQLAFHSVFLATCAAGLAPLWDGTRLVVQFHSFRPGANLTPHILLYVLAQFHNAD